MSLATLKDEHKAKSVNFQSLGSLDAIKPISVSTWPMRIWTFN